MERDTLNVAERCAAAQRRQQILGAAAACFRACGFHAASMAQIASAAQLSVGQIYRYFDNKEAIIAAIVEQDLEAFGRDVEALASENHGRISVLVGQLEEVIHNCQCQERKSMMLEVRAEASRNPKIAAMMADADVTVARHLRTLLAATPLASLPAPELDCRVELVRIIIDGALLRLGDGQGRRRAELDPLIRKALALALAPAPELEALA